MDLAMLPPDALLLVTGATGLVGRHVLDAAVAHGVQVRGLVRNAAANADLSVPGVELAEGSLTDAASLRRAATGVTHVVHCAAKVGDWGPVDDYRKVNVEGLKSLLDALQAEASVRRFVHVSSLGVYPARDHWGSDESTEISRTGIDGYTLSKVEAEDVVLQAVRERALPAVILRPGFIYGPHDRSVLPRLLERLRSGQFAYLGDRARLMNNTSVKNLVQSIVLALKRDDQVGEAFNITDGRLVTKEEFVGTIAELAGVAAPSRSVPLGLAKVLAAALETVWRWRGKAQAPILSRARIKFLGLNLDYSIDKARRVLGYNPEVDFQQGIAETMRWFRTHESQ
jgi:nucleoside-diphosphate-sugar epimerase